MARATATLRTATALSACLVLAACTVHKQETPSLTGPSELGKSLAVSVSPDVLAQDGQSQSVVSIDARDSNGQPLRNLPLRTAVSVNGAVNEDAQHVGTLSARSLVTDGSGHASVIYTAPGLQAGTFAAALGVIQIVVTPQEGDFGNSTPRFVSLKLVLPPGAGGPTRSGSLVANFTVNPAAPTEDQAVLFDASSSTTTGAPIVSYSWDFGDRRGASGLTATHSFGNAGTFVVTLTITDATGGTATASQSVTVGQGAAPTAVFTTSPSNPVPNADIFFNASQSKPAPGRTIASYAWDFGDGSPSASGVQVSHRYANPGSYVVTLVVTDDTGNRSVSTNTVSVSAGAPIADFTFLVAGSSAAFNSSTSSPAAGRTLVAFSWVFDDPASGLNNTSGLANPGHSFSTTGKTYNVTLTVTDDVGRTGTVTKQVTIP